MGTITQQTDSINSKTLNYTYDGDYRLLTVASSTTSENRTYAYDAVGNRKTETKGGLTYFYCYHATDCTQPPKDNRLINIRVGTLTGGLYRQFAYDDSGRLLQKLNGSGSAIYTLSYNGKGRPNQIIGTATNTLAYDANDYRIKKIDSFGTKNYHLEGEHLEATYNASGQLVDKYLRGAIIDEIVNGYHYTTPGTAASWKNYTFHHDQNNSVTATSGPNGSTEDQTSFDALGATLSTLGSSGNTLLYTGRELDKDTQLYYYRDRYYDAEIGRFTSQDRKGFGAGINFYAYVGNNPINANDPSGLEAISEMTRLNWGLKPYSPIPGQLTLWEANKHWREGNGAPLNVDISSLDLTNVKIPAVVPNKAFLANFDGKNYSSANDALVYGTVALIPGQNNTVVGGFDTYDFDIKPWSLATAPRNIATYIASAIAGEGKPYDIKFTGSAQVGSPGPAAANGGFLLYPNKPNTNQLQSVYTK